MEKHHCRHFRFLWQSNWKILSNKYNSKNKSCLTSLCGFCPSVGSLLLLFCSWFTNRLQRAKNYAFSTACQFWPYFEDQDHTTVGKLHTKLRRRIKGIDLQNSQFSGRPDGNHERWGAQNSYGWQTPDAAGNGWRTLSQYPCNLYIGVPTIA